MTSETSSSSAVTLAAGSLANVSVEWGAVLTLSDGTRLVADIYRPAGAGPWPVLLMRQPYGRDIASTVVYAPPVWFARQGFMVVIQDVRGRGASDGRFHAFRDEISDGSETVAWAAALPGANGRVGMYGFSYQGSTQLLAALGRPPALRALAPHMTAFDLYSGWFYRNGILQLSTTTSWGSQMLREDARRTHPEAEAALDANWLDAGRLIHAMPLREASALTRSDLPTYAGDWLRHSSYDAHWESLDLLKRIGDLGLPMFHLSGWYDFYLRGSVGGYQAMAAQHPNQFLLAAPWCHIPWGSHVGGTDMGPAARSEVDAQLVAWFHYWLDHDMPSGSPPLSGCRYFMLGENAWRNASTWPPPEAVEKIWYLAGEGHANSRAGDGRLQPLPGAAGEDVYNYDPEVPVTFPPGFGPHDLTTQQDGLNLLVYTTAPLETPVLLAGAPRCVLHVTSSAVETDFVVRLSRVTTAGRAIFLSLGACRAHAREGVEIVVQLDPVAVRFAAGEAIRIDVASSAFPLLVRNPNTGADPASITKPGEFSRALQVVHHDATRSSFLSLPVIPS
jgi:uncharacterized protein